MRFDEVVGQEIVKDRLRHMVREHKLPHALLLSGPAGSGALPLAIAFASYVLCQSPNKMREGQPCGECHQCRMTAKYQHPDLHFTYPTIKLPSMGSEHKPISDDFSKQWSEMLNKSAYVTLDQWLAEIGAENQQAIITAGESDSLSRKLYIKSNQGGYKVSIIWLPERMNAECANKLLKILEEPPTNTLFLMVSEEPDKLIETIRSRTQRIELLTEGKPPLRYNEEDLEFFGDFTSLTRQAFKRDIKALKRWSERLNGYGREKQKRFLDYFSHAIRESFVYNFQEHAINNITSEEEAFIRNFAPFVNEANILSINELADRAVRDIKQNANGRIVFFDMAMQMVALLRQKL